MVMVCVSSTRSLRIQARWDLFDLTVCNKCADAVADAIVNVCAISPIASVDYDVLYGEDFAQPDDDICDDGHIFLNFHNTYFKYSVKE